MKILSSAFENNQPIPAKYTCDGENIVPPLVFENVPAEAKSLAIIMNDPDSPSGDFLHWTIWNIFPDIKEIKEGLAPSEAREGFNDFGEIGYGGPCPGQGSHRYIFTIYALDIALEMPAGSKRSELEQELESHILKIVKLAGRYIKIKNRE